MSSVLVFAGLDPSGGAGLLADAEAIRAAGARPLCVATALTVQTTARARSFQPVAPLLVQEQARALLEEEDVRAVKIGMLGAEQVARAVRDVLAAFRGPVVVDPIFAASSGGTLFKGTPADAARAYLELAQGRILTPNLSEAAVLTGLRDAEAAARALIGKGVAAALVKGGHGEGEEATDVLAFEGVIALLSAPRLKAGKRGTGCRLSSAMAAGLAQGLGVPDAARRAKDLVWQYLLA